VYLVILSTTAVSGLTDGWFISLSFVILSAITVRVLTGSVSCSSELSCFVKCDGGVVHVVVCDIVDNNFMTFYKAVVRIVVCHILNCLKFDSRVMHAVFVIVSTTTV